MLPLIANKDFKQSHIHILIARTGNIHRTKCPLYISTKFYRAHFKDLHLNKQFRDTISNTPVYHVPHIRVDNHSWASYLSHCMIYRTVIHTSIKMFVFFFRFSLFREMYLLAKDWLTLAFYNCRFPVALFQRTLVILHADLVTDLFYD